MRVKYLVQEHNVVPRPGLEPGPPDLESSALTIRPPRLTLINIAKRNLYSYDKLTLKLRSFEFPNFTGQGKNDIIAF